MKNKNIWLLPTDKPSRLSYFQGKLLFDKEEFHKTFISQNIYITSDEEIIEGDWYLDTTINVVFKNDKIFLNGVGYKKIILTTDQDLIKDGVQAIDDEFLEWFVKNPSCEEVEVKPLLSNNGRAFFGYKIIIPKEEPKQETLEEAAERFSIGIREEDYKDGFIDGANWQQRQTNITLDDAYSEGFENGKQESKETLEEAAIRAVKSGLFKDETLFIAGAKWQQEQDKNKYSEEEVEDLIYKVCGTVARLQGIVLNGSHIDTAYKQFKKK